MLSTPTPYTDLDRQFIAGQWRLGSSEETQPDVNPYNEETLLDFRLADTGDVDAAYAASTSPVSAKRKSSRVSSLYGFTSGCVSSDDPGRHCPAMNCRSRSAYGVGVLSMMQSPLQSRPQCVSYRLRFALRTTEPASALYEGPLPRHRVRRSWSSLP